MKRPDFGAAEVITTSHNHNAESPKDGGISEKSISLYHKCLECKDYGVTCNGPKLAALGDIMIVREFHRAIRDRRSIPMKLIYVAAQPISESTINDYFSHSEKDFKWTTVGCIDNALTAICGNRVGQPLLDNPCPASSSDIQGQLGAYSRQIEDLKDVNSQLQEKVAETKSKVIAARDEVKEDYASRVQFLKDLCEQRQNDIDQLNKKHAEEISRLDALAKNYLDRIDEKNARIDRMSIALRFTTIFLVLALIALTCYIVWDIVHPSVGFILW